MITALAATGLVAPAANAAPSTQERPRTITLISGDKVIVDAKGALVGTEGRPGMSFVRYVADGHQFVVPEDALPLLHDDRIDKRFFDVTALLDFGYEDARIDRIPVLGDGARAASTAKVDAKRQWGGLLRSTGKVWLDGRAKLTLNESVPLVNAPQAWQQGFDGTGVTVAVLDTGYDQGHPELKDVVATSRDFTGLGIQDTNGHGTHVASTIAGRGAKYTGVAKGAKLAVGKVCEEFGCQESAIIAGMEWAAREVKAKVVSMSLGGDQSDGTDPLSQAVNRLSNETGALFVIAAGNSGQYRKVSSPASADAALAVANVTKQSRLNESSSLGPRLGDFAVKPDIAAPGTDIVAARAKDTLPEQAVDELHARLTGTSMATPHVAGAAAILVQQHPAWTAGELKAQLMSTTKKLDNRPDQAGTGLLDAGRASGQQVRVDTGSVSFGILEWPHTSPKSKTITYRNDGDQPITLQVSLPLNDFSLSASSVTVPAHGTAPLTVSVDGRKGLGKFYGLLTAEGPGTRLVTAVGAYVQEERHTLDVTVTGRDGKPAAGEYLLAINRTTGESTAIGLDAAGRSSAKLPAADYAILSRIKQYDEARHWLAPASATDIAGQVSLAQDATVVIDTRTAQPIKVDVGDPRVRVVHREYEMAVPMAAGKNSGFSGPLFGATDVYGLKFGADVPQLRYETLVKAAVPRVAISGAYDFPVGFFSASPPVSGKQSYRVALPEGDVRGALVVLQLKDGEEWQIPAHAQRLKDAGAAAVLQVGPIPLPLDQQTALPVIWAPQRLAAGLVGDLVAGKPVSLTVTGTETSPVSYNLFYPEQALPVGKTYSRGQVAEVKSRYHMGGADGLVAQRVHPAVEGTPARMNVLLDEWLLAPAARTEYYSAGHGIGWYREVTIGRMFGGDARDPLVGNWSEQRIFRFRPGEKTSLSWNAGVSAPRFGAPEGGYASWGKNLLVREGDQISGQLSVFSAGDALESWVRTGWGTLTLSRDGQSLGMSPRPWDGSWSVPSGSGRYELALSAERGGPPQIGLSTRIDTKWGFTSSASEVLPLLQVAYDAPLDLHNSARAGAPLPIRFTFPRQPGAGRSTVREWRPGRPMTTVPTGFPCTDSLLQAGNPAASCHCG
ncbi:peptidase [Lentzea sp. NBRC 105346]|uniref:S8 family serine peptidase n=1 Tax=Lentzea sp. NBRC 105346 TaxID=3032205 RepID=UPI0024A01CD5|nr:S8 family serine peptidase [Lentzea sp. NBRC 105346]GLZ33792.1 peptidase [Lentzea sp. NBRC 105346]